MPIYLDHAATSFPKPESVYLAVDQALRTAGGNPGRGGHQLALAANSILLETREAIASLFNIADAGRISFTANATEAINQALFGLLRPGDRVVTTSMEHNAVIRPLRALQERGVDVVKVVADRTGYIAAADFISACAAAPTTLAVLGHVSNVSGTIQPLPEIGGWCRRHRVPLLVDAAQSAGLLAIDVEALGVDLLAAPGHKGLLGPSGTGFLYVREGLTLQPLRYGGTGTSSSSDLMPLEMPERLESGTPNTPGLAGLLAGISYLQAYGVDRVRAHEAACIERLQAGLLAIEGVQLYGPPAVADRGGVLSFTLSGRDPSDIGFRLDREFDICVRVGLHCAPDAHRSLGTFPTGTVRVSPGLLTTEEEIDAFLAAMHAIARHPGSR